jgi:hypothetical protein
MAWSSTVPAALTALLAALEAAPGLEGVDVRDGPVVSSTAAAEAVIVGWYGQAGDELAVESAITQEGMAAQPDREQFVIRCAALVLNGSTDMTAPRARAYELLAACGAAVAADRTLAGTVMSAYVASHSLLQEQRQNGALATVEFGVACDAFTAR